MFLWHYNIGADARNDLIVLRTLSSIGYSQVSAKSAAGWYSSATAGIRGTFLLVLVLVLVFVLVLLRRSIQKNPVLVVKSSVGVIVELSRAENTRQNIGGICHYFMIKLILKYENMLIVEYLEKKFDTGFVTYFSQFTLKNQSHVRVI